MYTRLNFTGFQLIDLARFELATLTDYSDEEILAELRRVAALNTSGPLTGDTYQKLSPRVSKSTVGHRFGGWKKALEAAGLSHLHVSVSTPNSAKLQCGRAMTDDELIAEMQRVQSLLASEVLTAKDFSANSISRSDVFRERFGSWAAALERAGIAQARLGLRYTDELCYENIVTLWTHYGRQPQYRELKESPSTVGPKAYVLRWGSWRKALKAFVDWADAEDSNKSSEFANPVVETGLESAKPSLTSFRKEEDCREIRPGLRFRVFKRDRFRCIACRRSPATHLNIELHADHIVSVAEGGKTLFENLQTLCRDCNLGKGRLSIAALNT